MLFVFVESTILTANFSSFYCQKSDFQVSAFQIPIFKFVLLKSNFYASAFQVQFSSSNFQVPIFKFQFSSSNFQGFCFSDFNFKYQIPIFKFLMIKSNFHASALKFFCANNTYFLMISFCVISAQIAHNVLALGEVANFVTGYFRLLLNFLRRINVILPHNSQSRQTAVMPSVFYLFQFSVSLPRRFKFNHF